MLDLIIHLPPLTKHITTTIGTNSFCQNTRLDTSYAAATSGPIPYVMPEGGRTPFNIITKEILDA